jgi:ubiquinone/menaquinone biosynthesis C-methylase UbiE
MGNLSVNKAITATRVAKNRKCIKERPFEMDVKEENLESSKNYFDEAYESFFIHRFWDDTRIPPELKEIVAKYSPKTSLELGCGLGRFSGYMAEQGIKATGVDFSKVAIEKATKKFEEKGSKPTFVVGDVTNLKTLHQPFDFAFDIGCFHCLRESEQQKYVAETQRFLKPASVLLIWALDDSPSELKLGPDYIAKTFSKGFRLVNSKFSRRRIIASHWYWLVRSETA